MGPTLIFSFQANELNFPEKILLFMKKIIFGEFTLLNRRCFRKCRDLLEARKYSVPRVSIIMSKLYLKMCLNKGVAATAQLSQEDEEPYLGASLTTSVSSWRTTPLTLFFC